MEPEFFGDLVYKLKKIVGFNNLSAQSIKIISHYEKIGYNINVFRQTVCLVFNPITVGSFAFLFDYTPVCRTSDSMTVPTSRHISKNERGRVSNFFTDPSKAARLLWIFFVVI